MTAKVADKVLEHNSSQTLAPRLMQAEASHRLAEHAEFISSLE
jgi:NAD-specific glutamate dehydrogenase